MLNAKFAKIDLCGFRAQLVLLARSRSREPAGEALGVIRCLYEEKNNGKS